MQTKYTTHTPKSWYVAKTGNHQGLVIDEKTGANIAVAYDKADAPLLAAAPAMLDLLKRINQAFYVGGTAKALRPVMAETRAAIYEAERREESNHANP